MNHLFKRIEGWVKRPDFNDPDRNLSAQYIQVISMITILFTFILFLVYALDGQFTYVAIYAAIVLVYTIVIVLIRFSQLQIASGFFLVTALGLLMLGILSAGGIHASSSIIFPVILVYASLLLDRRYYIAYGALCITSMAFIIYAENRKLLPVYIPDPPGLPLFFTYALIMIATGIIVRIIAESLQNNLRKARQYAAELSVQKSMLDRVGQAVVACKSDNTIIYWNQAAAELYGWQVEDVLGRRYFDVIPAQATSKILHDIRVTLQSGNVWSGELVLQKKDRNWVRTLGTLSPLQDRDGNVIGWIGIAADLTARERIEFELRQRDSILEVVADAAGSFLRTPDWRASIDLVLTRLGETIHATHAYLFEHHPGPHGERRSSIRYEWTAPGYASDLDNLEFRDASLTGDGFEEYEKILTSGQPFIGNTSSFRPAEKEYFLSQGIKAIVEVPLFVNGSWWGTIGFDDFENERQWGGSEVDALKIAAGILSVAIQRQETESVVRESERIYRQAIEAADAVPYYQDYASDSYLFMGEGIHEMTGYRPEEMSPRVWLDIVQETIMLGDAAGMEADEAVQLVRQGKLKAWQCDQKILTRDGRIRWLTDRSIEMVGEDRASRGSIGILQDITERKLTEDGFRQREAMLKAITFSAEQFLKMSDWRASISAVLESLGRGFNASHAYLFEKHMGPDGVMLNSLRYEWTAPGQKPDMDNPSYQNAPEREEEFKRYYEILNRGEPYIGSSSYFIEEERAGFDRAGIKAILELRIVVGGKQWGTLGFDDMMQEREWTDVEVDVLKVAANLLGAAIKRQLDEEALQNELAERKRTEQALLFSEQKFFQAFHTTPVLMTLEDADERFVEVNDSFVQALEYTREEIIGHRAAEFSLIPFPEDRRAIRQSLEEKGIFNDLELRIRRKSGGMLTVLMSVEYLYVNDRRHILTSALDITERRQAEKKYRDIYNNSIDGIFQSTADGHFLSVNPAMARIYGYDSPEDMMHGVSDIGTQVYVNTEQRNEVLRRLNAGEKLTGYETLERRKDGAAFWSSMNAQAIYDESGKVLYYEGTVEDITPRKQAEAEREALIRELADKNAESETLRETTSIVTSTLDVTEAVQRILEQLKRVVPYDSASVWLYDGNIARLLGQDGLPGLLEENMHYTVTDMEPDHQFLSHDLPYILLEDVQEQYPQFREPPSNYIHGWLSIALKARGKLIGFISLDSRLPGRFTERDAHLALNFANQVSIALENARLFSELQSELDGRKTLIDELEKKNTELEQFTYTVSHDLKSPLVTINGFLGYLEQDAASGNMERLKKDTQRIQEAVHKMQKLLNELLELSRIGRMMNPPQAISFADLVEEAMDIVQGRLDERRVALHTQPNLPIVHGDKPRLVEVMQNLLDNAAKYMGDQPDPYIEIGQRGEEGGSPIFYVRDNGIGISPEHHERIFGLFNKLDAQSEGTGVGLALVKRIIELHGGRIWIESEAGKGAAFLFTLPFKPEADSVI